MTQNRRISRTRLLLIMALIFVVLSGLTKIAQTRYDKASQRAAAKEIRALHGLSRGDIFIRDDNVVIMTIDNLGDGRLRVTNQGPVIHGDYYTDEPRQGDPVEVIRHGTPRWDAVMDSIWGPRKITLVQ